MSETVDIIVNVYQSNPQARESAYQYLVYSIAPDLETFGYNITLSEDIYCQATVVNLSPQHAEIVKTLIRNGLPHIFDCQIVPSNSPEITHCGCSLH